MPEKGNANPPAEKDTEDLWKEFKQNGCAEIKKELIRRYQALVRYTAERMAASLPKSVDVDDLSQEGNFGLMDAIEKFDPERGIKFKTYCSTRIRGAILDALRTQDWVPRLARTRSNKAERVRQKFMSEEGREPTDAEMAEHLDLEVKYLNKAHARSMLNLSDRRPDSSERRSTIDTLSESAEDNPFDLVNRRDLMAVITRSLSEKERSILYMYYIDGLNLREIGERMALTESRVCQIHGNVIRRLRERLKGSADSFEI
ncbi:MAG: FliA/WhiG family RNA polymerase sigma factor [Planctomycetes bacterium]|nr:FliA/WhiG family RNA polymerase sigma factor [Planctomycetota bacterium]